MKKIKPQTVNKVSGKNIKYTFNTNEPTAYAFIGFLKSFRADYRTKCPRDSALSPFLNSFAMNFLLLLTQLFQRIT
ncbi:hypothetical protein N9L97_01280 [Cyclobacteriaceae bacterium]|nr:hypothetical protein [Cyclobacteriaceae bacterium]